MGGLPQFPRRYTRCLSASTFAQSATHCDALSQSPLIGRRRRISNPADVSCVSKVLSRRQRTGGTLTELELTYKKSLHAAEQSRPDVAKARHEWRDKQPGLAPRRLVFIDETWIKTNLPAYSPDLNPIEMACAKLKAHLRACAIRTVEAVRNAPRPLTDCFTPDECGNFLRHTSYFQSA